MADQQQITDLICNATDGVIEELTDDGEAGTKTVCDAPEKMLQHFKHVSEIMRDRLTCFAFIPAVEWWDHVKPALLQFPRLKTLYLFGVNNEVINDVEKILREGYFPYLIRIHFHVDRKGRGFSGEYFADQNKFSGWVVIESVWDTVLDENGNPICLKMILVPNLGLYRKLKNGA